MTKEQWKLELSKIPEDRRYDVEERAAIHEFDGGLDRDAAERLALEPDQKEFFTDCPY